jgi:hypothetical protein
VIEAAKSSVCTTPSRPNIVLSACVLAVLFFSRMVSTVLMEAASAVMQVWLAASRIASMYCHMSMIASVTPMRHQRVFPSHIYEDLPLEAIAPYTMSGYATAIRAERAPAYDPP